METISLSEMIHHYGAVCTHVPRSVHSKHGDFVAVIFTNDMYYTKRVDELLTLHLSCDNHKLVGCTIKGLSLLAAEMATVEGDEVTLAVVLMAMLAIQKHRPDLKPYLNAAQQEGVRIPRRFFEPVC